jgi:hypothetical protein
MIQCKSVKFDFYLFFIFSQNFIIELLIIIVFINVNYDKYQVPNTFWVRMWVSYDDINNCRNDKFYTIKGIISQL